MTTTNQKSKKKGPVKKKMLQFIHATMQIDVLATRRGEYESRAVCHPFIVNSVYLKKNRVGIFLVA